MIPRVHFVGMWIMYQDTTLHISNSEYYITVYDMKREYESKLEIEMPLCRNIPTYRGARKS